VSTQVYGSSAVGGSQLTQQQQVDSLLDEISDEVQLDKAQRAHHDSNAGLGPAADVTARLSRLHCHSTRQLLTNCFCLLAA